MPTLSTIGAACARAWGFTSGLVKDQYFNLVSLLLPGNGTNGAQNNTFLDSGTANSGSGFTITRNGNTTQGTFSPFSQTGWSNYFAGGGNYLTVADSTAFDLPGDFTIEFEVYPLTRNNALFGLGDYRTANNGMSLYYDIGTGTLRLYSNGADVLIGASAVPLNQWSHIAIVRSGTSTNNLKLYINGVFDTQGTTNASFTGVAGNGVSINVDYGGSYQATGPTDYISNVRIVKGQALTSGNFTPPTAPLTTTSVGWTGANAASSLTGTISLLICQANRFRDASGNGFTITTSGSPSVTPFSPFAPTAAYSAAAVGGSGYFDGTGDYLSTPYNANLALGSGNFTVEAWVYTNQASGFPSVFGRWSNALGSSWDLRASSADNSNKPVFAFNDGTTNTIISSSGGSVADNAWHHLAAVRNGNTITLYVDGSSVGSASFSGTIAARTSTPQYVGYNDSNSFQGYISNCRLITGQALATGNFTPPTAPVTASAVGWTGANAAGSLSGTVQFLTNFTNAGVVDATAKNVLETVGNAQISTTQSKFGGGSMYFDGTGDWLYGATNNPMFGFGTGNFTIEFWAWKSANGSAGGDGVISVVSGSTNQWYLELSSDRGFIFWNKTTAQGCQNNTTTGINDSTWHHWAVCRSGSTWYLFKDGVALTKTTDAIGSSSISGGTIVYIGNGKDTSDYPFNGYIDDLRVTKGYARYTANFPPPTAPYPVQ